MESKNFKPMECPVCHEYYFTDDTELEKEDPDYEGKQRIWSPTCRKEMSPWWRGNEIIEWLVV